MKIRVEKASDWDYESEVEINTIEELIQFSKDCDSRLILSGCTYDNPTIIIYDYYVE